MDEAKTFTSPAVSVGEIWNRLVPLLVLSYQAVVLLGLVVAAVLAFGWFRQPFLGVFVSPGMVIEHNPQAGPDWHTQTALQGLPQQDILIAIDGQPVNNAQDLQAVLEPYQPGDQVELQLKARSGHTTTRTITLSQLSRSEQVEDFFLPFGLAVVFLGAGFWAVRARLDDPATRIFGILTI